MSGLCETAAALALKAVSDALHGEPDWGLNMDLSDLVNDDLPAHVPPPQLNSAAAAALAVLASCLRGSAKGGSTSPLAIENRQSLALTALETLVNNGNGQLHALLAPTGCLAAVEARALQAGGAGGEDGDAVGERCLGLVQRWGEQLGDQTADLRRAFERLRERGVAFPLRSVAQGGMAPIVTPPPVSDLGLLAPADRAAVEAAIAEADAAERAGVLAAAGAGGNPWHVAPGIGAGVAALNTNGAAMHTSANLQAFPTTAAELPASSPPPPPPAAPAPPPPALANSGEPHPRVGAEQFRVALNSAEVLCAILADIPAEAAARVFDEVIDQLVSVCSRAKADADRVLSDLDRHTEDVIEAVLAAHAVVDEALAAHKALVVKAQQGEMLDAAATRSRHAALLPPPPPPPATASALPPSDPPIAPPADQMASLRTHEAPLPPAPLLPPPPSEGKRAHAASPAAPSSSIMELSNMASMTTSENPGKALAGLLDLDDTTAPIASSSSTPPPTVYPPQSENDLL